MERSSPMLARGVTIDNWIIITIFHEKFSSAPKNESVILLVSANPKIKPVKIKPKQESPKKNMKTFLANDSLNV
jgi:hypothetical protein